MAGPRADKVAVVEEVRDHLERADAAILTEYRGLKVADLATLRRALREAGAEYKIYKNTLVKLATAGGDHEPLHALLEGPTAIAFVDGDVVEAAKGLRDFAKTNPLLVIKGGVLDGKAITPAEIISLADLEPRDVLLAKLAGAMKASLAGAAATFNALPVQMAQLAEALRAKLEAAEGAQAAEGGPAAPPAAEAPDSAAPDPEAAPDED